MKRFLPILFLLAIFYNCGNNTALEQVYFAGQIVNPTSDFVVLFKDEIPIDSCKLDEQNMFTFNLRNIKEGLYSFQHDPEYQYIYLSKGDSLVLRLNTIDFDESLVFEGKGKEINNFLIEIYLENEKEMGLFRDYYKLKPKAFEAIIDSLMENKLTAFNELKENSEITKEALNIAEASFNYVSYFNKEKYPYKHKKYTKEKVSNSLSSNYYDYRTNLNFNDSNLTFYKPYYDFIKCYVDNLSYATCLDGCYSGSDFKYEPYHFNVHKLKLVDSLVKEKNLRDNLFRSVAMNFFIKSRDNNKNNASFLEELHKVSKDNKHFNEIESLFSAIDKIQPGNMLPEILLESSNGELRSLKDISKNKNIVFYFWTGTQKRHLDYISKKVKHLASAYPDYEFVGICIRTDTNNWHSLIQRYNLDPDQNYRSIKYKELANALIIDKMNKGIVVKKGLIDNAFANINNPFN